MALLGGAGICGSVAVTGWPGRRFTLSIGHLGVTVGVAVPEQCQLGLQFVDPGGLDHQLLYDQAGMGQGDHGVDVRMAHRQRLPSPGFAQERVAVGFTVLAALPRFLPQYPHVGGQADPALDGVMGPYPADLAQGGVGH